MSDAPPVSWPAALQSLDESILRAARGAPISVVPVFYVLTIVGGGWILFALIPLLARRSTRSFALWVGVTVGLTSLLVNLVKEIVQRTRPCDALAWAEPIDIANPHGFSFPSGHAAGSFAFAAFMVVWSRGIPSRRWAIGLSLAAVVYASLVAWSRCVLCVHYPTDVMGGAILGCIVGSSSAVLRSRRLGSP